MILDKVIFSVDDNPKYKDLWPIVSEICFKKTGITPVLFYITNEDSDFYRDEYGLVKKVKSIEGISSGIQSQLIRMWGTKFFPDEVCLTSDIDMIMFSKEYFVDQVVNFKKDDLIIYCSDAYDTQRSECVGIYGENRYPICYNAGTGNTFNKILGTDDSFENYIEKVLSMGFPDFDSDEMYFGHSVNSQGHGVNVIKLKRGFYSKFKCPRRIDRISDSLFNKYDDRLIFDGHYVDCHLSRPVSKYSREIDLLKSKILKNKEVYLIGCHIDTPKQLSLLSELVGKLTDAGKDYIITSHTLVPEFIIKNSVGFIYDSINPKYKTWELERPNKYVIDYGSIRVESPYITYGRRDYYHIGVLRLILNGLKYLSNLNYDVVHWIEYDALPDFKEDHKNLERLSDNDFVFYGIGSKFSFLNRSVSKEFLKSTNGDLLKMLSENDYVAEKVISENIICGKKVVYDVAGITEFYGRHSHNSETQFDWSLYEDGDNVSIFIDNKGSINLRFTLKYDGVSSDIECRPGTWLTQPISKRDRMSDLYIESNGDLIVNLDLTDNSIYDKVVRSVSVVFK
jgi:hypothetical protein